MVLSDEVFRSTGSKIYSKISREGSSKEDSPITQLISVIPKTIFTNTNTKIILGNGLSTERASILSALQDLSTDHKNITRLAKGETIIISNFVKVAVPIKIPLFKESITNSEQTYTPKEKVRVMT